MLQRNHCVQSVDVAFTEEFGQRLPLEELRELQSALTVNLTGDDGDDAWLDEEIPVGYVTEIDEDEFFARYFGVTE